MSREGLEELVERWMEDHAFRTAIRANAETAIRVRVAKVVVPGLRHFWARFAPGGLYDVPVSLGWLPRPLTEDALNPIPMFW